MISEILKKEIYVKSGWIFYKKIYSEAGGGVGKNYILQLEHQLQLHLMLLLCKLLLQVHFLLIDDILLEFFVSWVS